MTRTVKLGVLESIRIASPCPAEWRSMTGDDRVRFCGECRLNVYNLSAMTREEAEALVVAREGKMCARFYRRADGTVLTRDCPVGLRAVRIKVAAVATRVAAAFTMVMWGIAAMALGPERASRLRQSEPFATICRWIGPAAPPVLLPMGRVCITGSVVAGPGPAPAALHGPDTSGAKR